MRIARKPCDMAIMYRQLPYREGNVTIFGGNRHMVPWVRGIATPVCALVRNDRKLEGEAAKQQFSFLPTAESVDCRRCRQYGNIRAGWGIRVSAWKDRIERFRRSTGFPGCAQRSAQPGITALRLFPLHRSGGLGGDVVDDAIDAGDGRASCRERV